MEFFDLVVTQVSRLTIIPEVKRQGKGGKLRNLLTLTPRRRKTNRARKREKISFENVKKKKKRKGTKTGGPWVRGGIHVRSRYDQYIIISPESGLPLQSVV